MRPLNKVQFCFSAKNKKMITGGLEEERMLTYIEYFEDDHFRLLPQLGKRVRYSVECKSIPA